MDNKEFLQEEIKIAERALAALRHSLERAKRVSADL